MAAQAPTGNYAFDVHIDTGAFALGGTLLAAMQDFCLTPAWIALVWIVHALIVALEWCYSLDLLGGSTLGALGGALRSARDTFTDPWLAAALSIAAVLVAYRGLVRRQVAESLGDALMMLAMMAACLAVIADPPATIGALSRLTNDTSLATLAAVQGGAPARPEATLAAGMQDIFSGAIGQPWCYLEFGNVRWCEDPAQLDPSLRSAALRIAGAERHAPDPGQRLSAELLMRAQTNGELFLALPADGEQRNSINDPSSLLRILCDSPDATNCQGPAAAEAEFRTGSGTWSRAGGLLLIMVGSAGMIALLCFIALRLLGAAIASLLYLLVAPVALLAPALGETGRAAFRGWAGRLLAALLAKLLYSALLGAVLLVLRLLLSLNFGWWTEWLLAAVLWWTAYQRRHQLLSAAPMAGASSGRRGARPLTALLYGRELARLARAARPRSGPDVPPERPPRGPRRPHDDRPTGHAPASGAGLHELADRALAEERRDPGLSARRLRLEQDRGRLAALRTRRQDASAAGEPFRARLLDRQARRTATRIASEEHALGPVRASAPPGAGEDDLRQRWLALLRRQADLPSARDRAGPGAERRDYAAIARVAELSPQAYDRLSAGERRRMRLRLDRELQDIRAGTPSPVVPPTEGEKPEEITPTAPAHPAAPPAAASVESPVMRRERQLLADRGPRERAGRPSPGRPLP